MNNEIQHFEVFSKTGQFLGVQPVREQAVGDFLQQSAVTGLLVRFLVSADTNLEPDEEIYV